jgi:hypothetical protein
MNDTDVAARLGATFGHEPSEVHDSKGFTGRTCCGNCFTDWPCPAVRKIERVMVPVVREIADRRAAEAERRGYERGRRDFQFAPEGDNHHNAAMCPYCSPAAAAGRAAAEAERLRATVAALRGRELPPTP